MNLAVLALNHLRRVLCMALVIAVYGAGAVAAQTDDRQQEFFDTWMATAKRAEAAIEAAKASNAAFEGLRNEIAGYRGKFENAGQRNAARIDTLRSQLTALGPPPVEGASEPADIAALRDDLTTQIGTLRVPVVVSREAYNRARGMIGEIDRIIRDRQTGRLFSRAESPLTPALWPVALRELYAALNDIVNETTTSLNSQIGRLHLRDASLRVLMLAVAGLVLLARGRAWPVRIGNFMRGLGGRGFGVWGFLISLGRIGLPLGGVYLLSRAVAVSQILGLRGELVLEAIPFWATTVLGFMWLGERLVPRRDEDAFVPMGPDNRAVFRRNLLAIGATLVLHDAVNLFGQIENVSDGVRAVVGLPVILLGAVVLVRLRHILGDEAARHDTAGAEPPRRNPLTTAGPFVRRFSGLVAVVAPVLAMAGYGHLAEAIMYPALLSIALFGLLLVLQKFCGDLYAWSSGKGQAAESSVVPVLIGFLLALVSLPALALIWGARMADLTELWDRILQGVVIGETRISPTDFLTFAIVFVVGYSLTRLFSGALATNFLPKTRLDQGGRNAVVSGVRYLGIFLSAVIAISMAGIDLSSLAIVAGALSVGIGFGLQTIVSNFVSGIILLIERPISEGDWIEVGGHMGYVRDISVRSTRIETFDRSDVIIPNADLISGTVTNYTRGNTIGRLILSVGVAYGTDTRLVESILLDIAGAHPMVLSDPAPYVVFKEFGADSLNFEVRAILRDVNWVLSVRSDMNHQINRRFSDAGIEIPFAQRDVWLRNPEALGAAAAPLGQDAAPRPGETSPAPPDLGDMQGDGGDGDGDGGGNGG